MHDGCESPCRLSPHILSFAPFICPYIFRYLCKEKAFFHLLLLQRFPQNDGSHKGVISDAASLAFPDMLAQKSGRSVAAVPLPVPKISNQQMLFPEHVDLSREEATALREILPELEAAGFELTIEETGANISGIPGTLPAGSLEKTLHELTDTYLETGKLPLQQQQERMAAVMARNGAFVATDEKSIRQLLNELSECDNCNYTPNGKPISMPFQ